MINEADVNSPDWNFIANAIRDRRFGDVAPEEWTAVADIADNLAPKKRGRKHKHVALQPAEQFMKSVGGKAKSWFTYDEDVAFSENAARWMSHFEEFILAAGASEGLSLETCYKIRESYTEMRRRGIKSVRAKAIIAEKLEITPGHKFIEAVLTAVTPSRV